jgi:hypothetical protein
MKLVDSMPENIEFVNMEGWFYFKLNAVKINSQYIPLWCDFLNEINRMCISGEIVCVHSAKFKWFYRKKKQVFYRYSYTGCQFWTGLCHQIKSPKVSRK